MAVRSRRRHAPAQQERARTCLIAADHYTLCISKNERLTGKHMHDIERRLTALGIELPRAPKAIGNFCLGVELPGLLLVSGTYGTVVDADDNDVLTVVGKLGADVTVEDGYRSARLAGINLLAMAKQVVGDLDRIRRVVRIAGMVATSPGFQNAPSVVNGASDLMVDVFGADRGRHARIAFPVHELARDAPVACEAWFQLRD